MTAGRRVLARSAQYLFVLWAALTLCFALPRLAPGDPLEYVIGPEVGTLTPEQRTRVLAELGLDRPVPVQYLRYLAGITRGDLGFSIRFARPVRDLLLDRLPWTLLLVLPALALSTVLGALLGTLAAWRRRRRTDIALLGSVLFLDALPAFWIGMLLIAVVSVRLGWLPSFGAEPIVASGPIDHVLGIVRRAVLPITTLTLAGIGHTFLLVRGTLLTTLDEDHVLMAQASGLRERDVMLRHGLRNALLPLYTRVALAVGGITGGAVLVETVFGYPGVGRLIFEAVSARDYPLLEGAFLLSAVSVLAANWIADATYPLIDPRVRRAAEHD